MTITQMQYFSMVCQFQSISKAAEQLFVSQPALSASLLDLEKEIGFRLFERRSRGVVTTEEGRLLLQHVDSVLKRYNLLMRSLPELAEHQNILHVGFRPTSGENEFFSLFKKYRQVQPDVRLQINEMSNNSPSVYLEDGTVDFLICPLGFMKEGWHKKYQRRKVGEGGMQLYCSKESPLAQKDILQIEDLDNAPMVFWEGQQATMNRIREEFQEKGLHLNIVAVMPQITGVLNFICSNIAAGLLSGDYLTDIPALHRCQLSPSVDFGNVNNPPDIYMFWKKQIENYQIKKDFIDFVKKSTAQWNP